MVSKRLAQGIVLVLASSLAACGDDDAGFSCDELTFSPCGGDIVGTWNLIATCQGSSNEELFEDVPECSSSTFESEFEGLVAEFGSDGNYSISEAALNTEVSLDDACLTALGQGAPAALLCAAFESEFTDPSSEDSFDSGSCNYDGSTCTCELADSQEGSTGTYTTSGGEFTTTEPGEDPETQEYCSEGDRTVVHIDSGDGFDVFLVLDRQ